MTLVTLPRGTAGNLVIRPRWPAKAVSIDPRALHRLQEVQARLAGDIQLIITRGFEPKAGRLGAARRLFRRMGVLAFMTLYPRRRSEIGPIFGSNGHDVDGTHVDISICLSGRRIRPLPLGVFTPTWLQRQRLRRVSASIAAVQAEISRAGFDLHANATERLQMHCDLRDETVATECS
ncbi:MAG: hypothetical protein JO142_00095 [Burkholderiales bacterium]|nr:hypothetical protein [Burkholderiales bacterium]